MKKIWLTSRLAIAFVAVLLAASASFAQTLKQQELRIPMAEAGAKGLDAVLIWPDLPGRHPLALINHGSPRSNADRPDMTPLAMIAQAREFARRGWVAALVLRRGYGASGGGWAEGYGSCARPNYAAAAAAARTDLLAAIAYLGQLPQVDASRVLAVGVSAGAFATLALTAPAPPGLRAAIAFAPGRGSLSADSVCNPAKLVATVGGFGARSRIPTLWVVAENDHFFSPSLMRRMRDQFVALGGKAELIVAGPYGQDGHQLFSAGGIPIWTPMVDRFLAQQKLTLLAAPLPLPLPRVAVPPQLSGEGRKAFAAYLAASPHKAFAVAVSGSAFGWRSGRRDAAEAATQALALCAGKNGRTCRIVMQDDEAMR